MDLQESLLNQTNVSFSLTKNVISAEAKDKNLVISPLSIHVVLSLLTAGSTGPTRDQLLRFLKCESRENLNSLFSEMVSGVLANGSQFGGPYLSSANGVWVDMKYHLKQPFRETVESAYGAVIKNVDFRNEAEKCREEVNKWADKETKGMIKEILPPASVDNRTILVLGNAVYFKGAWAEKFDSSLTKPRQFFLLNGSSVEAPMMTSNKKQYVRAFDGFKVLRLPYEQGKDMRLFSMYIFLPDARDGLPSLVERAGSESGFIQRHIPYGPVTLTDFRIPKFKIEFDFKASDVFKGQGLELPFRPVGGFVDMVDGEFIHAEPLFVTEIYHKAVIEVNEEGTEAAAVTVCGMAFGCSRFQREVRLDFVAAHPFLFVVREDTTRAVLFTGQLLNPVAPCEF